MRATVKYPMLNREKIRVYRLIALILLHLIYQVSRIYQSNPTVVFFSSFCIFHTCSSLHLFSTSISLGFGIGYPKGMLNVLRGSVTGVPEQQDGQEKDQGKGILYVFERPTLLPGKNPYT